MTDWRTPECMLDSLAAIQENKDTRGPFVYDAERLGRFRAQCNAVVLCAKRGDWVSALEHAADARRMLQRESRVAQDEGHGLVVSIQAALGEPRAVALIHSWYYEKWWDVHTQRTIDKARELYQRADWAFGKGPKFLSSSSGLIRVE